MKKSTLLNSDLSYLTATLGHTDEITIADAGLPIPPLVQRIDLALTQGTPGFIQTVEVMLQESQIDGVIIAEETKVISPDMHAQLIEVIQHDARRMGRETKVTYVSHDEFKRCTAQSRAVIRTGECTPYANVIFQIGVTF